MIISKPILHQTLAITPVALGNLMTGLAWGWLSPTIHKLQNSNGHIYLTNEDCSWMVSAQFPGFILGCLISNLIADFRRNLIVVFSAIITLLSWIIVALTKTVILLELARVAAGTSMGMVSVIMSIYIGENSAPNVRGVFNSICSLLMGVGMLFSCTLATYCSYHTTAHLLVAISVMNLLSGILLKEPAQLLMAKGYQAEAEDRFFWLRGTDDSTKKEFNDLKSMEVVEKPFSISYLVDRHLQITCIASALTFMTGYPAVLGLVSIILVPTQHFTTNEQAILFNFFLVIGFIVSPFIIDRFKRRTLWMLSAILVATSLFSTAVLCILREKGLRIAFDEWLLFASVTAYAAIFSTAMYPLALIVKSELLPQKMRTFGTSLSTITNSMAGMLVGHSFLWISASYGVHTNYICYTIFSLITLVFAYFYIPETKGMPLVEIERMLA